MIRFLKWCLCDGPVWLIVGTFAFILISGWHV
jgi:hypothetical protein